MRNISHIQLKEIETFDEDDEDFEVDGDDIRPRRKHYVQGASSNSSGPRQRLIGIFDTMTSTNSRKAALLIVIVLMFVTLTITVSFVTKSKVPANHNGIYNELRLPSWIRPMNYLVHVTTNMTAFTFEGAVVASLNITGTDGFIVIHADQMNLTSVHLVALDAAGQAYPNSSAAPHGAMVPSKITFNENNTYYIFEFDELSSLLQDGHQYFDLYINYKAEIGTKLLGFYRSHYLDPDEKWIAMTQFEPSDARKAFPCFDEPAFKAAWTIWLEIESEYSGMSNMPERSNTLVDGSPRRLVKFETTPAMSSYLVCFLVHQLKASTGVVTNAQGRNIDVRVWSSNRFNQSRSWPLEVAQKSIEFFTKYFDIEYPLAKMDLIGVADFAAGAMENWGCLTFRELDLFYSPSEASVEDKQRVAEVVAHEIAHQWFGDLVTMKWWNDLWLNEGFATFMSYKCLEATIPDFNSPQDFLYLVKQSGLIMDAKANTHSISNNYVRVIDIESSFDAITYDKGSSVLVMLESMLQRNNQDQFQIGIRNYLKSHAYSNAETVELWQALTSATDGQINVPDVMDVWVAKPGYPLVTITSNPSNPTSHHVSQSRFYDSNTADATNSTETWQIPLSIQTGCENTQFLLNSKSNSIEIKDCDFAMLNFDGTGFFRVKYDDAMFQKIVSQLSTPNNTINIVGAIQFVDDAFNFVKSGLLPAQKALEMAKFVNAGNYTSNILWKTTVTGVSMILGRMSRQECYPQLVELAKKTFADSLSIERINQLNTGKYQDLLLRKALISIGSSLHIDSIVDFLNTTWYEFKDTPEKIDVNIRRTMYSSIVANGGYHQYDWMYNRFLNGNTSSNEKNDALRALGSVKQPYLVQRSFDLILNKQVRNQDYSYILGGLSGSAYTMDSTWSFITENYDFFSGELSASSLGDLVFSIGQGFDTHGKYSEFTAFIEKHPELPQARLNIAIDDIKANIAWLKASSKDLCTYAHSIIVD
eukprot:gene6268-7273_t